MKASALTPLELLVAARVATQAAMQPKAVRLWVFGSRARGASTEHSDLDLAVEFSAPESSDLRAWLERARIDAEEPVATQWPGFVGLVGLYADDVDPRLRRRVVDEGLVLWERQTVPAELAR
jgi:predicted nucleotidyltransferase